MFWCVLIKYCRTRFLSQPVYSAAKFGSKLSCGSLQLGASFHQLTSGEVLSSVRSVLILSISGRYLFANTFYIFIFRISRQKSEAKITDSFRASRQNKIGKSKTTQVQWLAILVIFWSVISRVTITLCVPNQSLAICELTRCMGPIEFTVCACLNRT